MRADRLVDGASVPRARFIASLLAVALLAAGCGGGEEDVSEEPEGTRDDGVSEVTTDDDDQPDTVRDSAEAGQGDAQGVGRGKW